MATVSTHELVNPRIVKKSVVLHFVCLVVGQVNLSAQVNPVRADQDWASRQVTLKHTAEAECIIRIGDVDNLGWGWPPDFDPFCGFTTQSHPYPWSPDPAELPGFDRILLSSRYKGSVGPCNSDGYSESWKPNINRPVPFAIPTRELAGWTIHNATLQLFIDDFQAPVFCSKFQMTLNGRRFVEGEKILNRIEQTGPVGKLVSIPIPEEFYPDILSEKDLMVSIDETQGVPDGFAIDFIRLVINRKRMDACMGHIAGVVVDKATQSPIAHAVVSIAGWGSAQTDVSGAFRLEAVPSGYVVIAAAAEGYNDGGKGSDVNPNETIEGVVIPLEKGLKKATYSGLALQAGQRITLNQILFDQGKAELRKESETELDKIWAFMNAHPAVEIELSGHTSSEGDAGLNRSLSYRRVNVCKTYLVRRGLDPGRVVCRGYGPDMPVAPNDTEVNRAKNRRVEMRILAL